MKCYINYRSKGSLCHSMQTTQVLTKSTKKTQENRNQVLEIALSR